MIYYRMFFGCELGCPAHQRMFPGREIWTSRFCIYTYKYKRVFFTLRHFFPFRPRVFPRVLGSVAHREPAPTPYASLGPGRGPWHVLRELKVARPLGEAFRARRAIQAHANPNAHYTLLTGWKSVQRLMRYLRSWMSSMSSDITYLVMEFLFPDTISDMPPFTVYTINLRPSSAKLINYKPTHNHPYCVPHLRN